MTLWRILFSKERREKMRILKKVIKKTILILIIFFFVVSFLLPILLTITNSFMKEDEVIIHYGGLLPSDEELVSQSGYRSEEISLVFFPELISFKQYIEVLVFSPEYLFKFWNSVFMVVPIVILQLGTGLFAAFAFTRYRRKRGEAVFFVYTILMLLPFQATLVPNYMIAKSLGIYDTFLAIILPGAFSTFSVYLLTKSMRRIPKEILEAAMLDGASEWVLFTKICVPMSKNIIVATAMLVFIEYWNMVEQPLVLLEDVDKYPLSVYLSQINTSEISLAFAVAVIYMIPTILVTLYGEEYLMEGIAGYGKK